jgi:hypothetical protein
VEHILTAGGAGFGGPTLADRLLCEGEAGAVVGSLAGRGATSYLDWPRRHGARLRFAPGGVRDAAAVVAGCAGLNAWIAAPGERFSAAPLDPAPAVLARHGLAAVAEGGA